MGFMSRGNPYICNAESHSHIDNARKCAQAAIAVQLEAFLDANVAYPPGTAPFVESPPSQARSRKLQKQQLAMMTHSWVIWNGSLSWSSFTWPSLAVASAEVLNGICSYAQRGPCQINKNTLHHLELFECCQRNAFQFKHPRIACRRPPAPWNRCCPRCRALARAATAFQQTVPRPLPLPQTPADRQGVHICSCAVVVGR